MHDKRLDLQLVFDVGRVPASACDGALHELVHRHVVERLRRLALPGEIDDVAHEQRELIRLLDQVLEQLLPLGRRQRAIGEQYLEVCLQARQRRAQLVRRVGDQMALRHNRALERLQRRVERLRKPPQLVVGRGLEPAPEVGRRRDRLGLLRKSPHRPQGCPRHGAAEHRREHNTADGDAREQQQQAVQHAIGLAERPRHLDRAAAGKRCAQHPDVAAADVLVLDHHGSAAPRDVRHARIDREREILAGPEQPAAGGDELHDAPGASEPRVAAVWGRGRGGAIARVLDPRLEVLDLRGAVAERRVDLAAQLRPDGDVGADGGQRDCDRNRRGGRHRETPPDRHAGFMSARAERSRRRASCE